ncbi:hypothetical protein EXIGLDRAFT_784594 [Exidia glandulosa HHB12029]|uniref:Uncharacterized protein n=1 Tax=Exidia glandulosa HHB12029 TaxID=1314781 RepID=A0A166MDH9_EXIGL|nr:hypothetical protein EXIGLDRAFT_784594 [Exidia glandulosa HHB12029]
MSNLPRPPPPVPRLETLQIHYHRSRSWRTIDAIEPWRLDLDYDEAWHCPNLRTLEILLGITAEEAKKHSDKANPIELRARSIFWFVKGELPGGDVRRVFVRGDGFRVLSDPKSDEPLPFELVVDQKPCTITMPDMQASFSGFD